MNKILNKKTLFALMVLLIIVYGLGIGKHYLKYETVIENINVSITVESQKEGYIQLFYSKEKVISDNCFSEDNKQESHVESNDVTYMKFVISPENNMLRIDFPAVADNTFVIRNITFDDGHKSIEFSPDMMAESLLLLNQVDCESIIYNNEIHSTGDDSFFVFNIEKIKSQFENKVIRTRNIIIAVAAFIGGTAAIILLYRNRTDFYNYAKDIVQSRKLLGNLAKNDLKSRFAGSYLGIVWSFIQPIVTVFVYWFVFQIGLRNSSVVTVNGDIPFVLWFVAGLVPWFFYSEAWNTATNVLVDYSYLVKKVVFKIDILPLVKMLSGLIVHVFFVVFVLLLYLLYGKFPGISAVQVIYYSLCMFVLVLGQSYLTCACLLFFRDLSQIINIWMQMGIWLTPIMWNIETIDLPKFILPIFRLNPMFYVVQGYRDALINKIWFWERTEDTIYFWVFTIIAFVLGRTVFRKLKPHFADVL